MLLWSDGVRLSTKTDEQIRRREISHGAVLLHEWAFHGEAYKIHHFLNSMRLSGLLDSALRAVDDDGLNALHHAAVGGQHYVVIFLLDFYNADPYSRTREDGLMAVHFSAQLGHTKTVQYFLDKHYNTEQTLRQLMDYHGQDLLFHAIKQGQLELATHLVARCGFDPSSLTSSLLLAAACCPDICLIPSLIQWILGWNCIDCIDILELHILVRQAFHLACLAESVELTLTEVDSFVDGVTYSKTAWEEEFEFEDLDNVPIVTGTWN